MFCYQEGTEGRWLEVVQEQNDGTGDGGDMSGSGCNSTQQPHGLTQANADSSSEGS